MNDETAITIYTGGDQGATSYVAAVARERLNARPGSALVVIQRPQFQPGHRAAHDQQHV
jgi:hypothetical protein